MGMSHILQSTGRSLLLLVFLSSCQALAMLYPDRVQAEDTTRLRIRTNCRTASWCEAVPISSGTRTPT